MTRIFYKPDLTIVGISTGEESMEFPSIITKETYWDFANLYLKKEKGKIVIKFKYKTLKERLKHNI